MANFLDQAGGLWMRGALHGKVGGAFTSTATQHGGLRRAQGYTTTGLVEDYNLIRRCVSALAEKNLNRLDAHLLLHDLAQLSEALDIQLQHALKKFLARA